MSYNSRAGNDIDMKLGPVTKLAKRNTATSKIFGGDVVLSTYDAIIFSIYGWFGAIQN